MGWAVIGLGNPGKSYTYSRHNVGFMVVDSIASEKGLLWEKSKNIQYAGPIKMGGNTLWLGKPRTYMNHSGVGALSLFTSKHLHVSNLIVVHDDLDLGFGELRFKFGGGSGGHKGIESIVVVLGTKKFYRGRVGVGRPGDKEEIVEFVLSNFSRQESKHLPALCLHAYRAIELLINDGIVKVQDAFNRKILI